MLFDSGRWQHPDNKLCFFRTGPIWCLTTLLHTRSCFPRVVVICSGDQSKCSATSSEIIGLHWSIPRFQKHQFVCSMVRPDGCHGRFPSDQAPRAPAPGAARGLWTSQAKHALAAPDLKRLSRQTREKARNREGRTSGT